MSSDLKDLWVVLFDHGAVEKNMYPFHIERISETIEHNLRAYKDKELSRGWHVVGICGNSTEASERVDEVARIIGYEM